MLEPSDQSFTVLFQENSDEGKVKEFIARFSSFSGAGESEDASAGVEGDVKAGGAGAVLVELGRAPPCELYSSLKPICVLEQSVEEYHKCTQPSQIKD